MGNRCQSARTLRTLGHDHAARILWVRDAHIVNARKQNINKTAQYLVGPCMNRVGAACSSDEQGERQFKNTGMYPANKSSSKNFLLVKQLQFENTAVVSN